MEDNNKAVLTARRGESEDIMRPPHELDSGVICEKCLHISTKKSYKRITTNEPVVSDTTGRCKVVHRMNLCNQCYDEYIKLVDEFCGRK